MDIFTLNGHSATNLMDYLYGPLVEYNEIINCIMWFVLISRGKKNHNNKWRLCHMWVLSIELNGVCTQYSTLATTHHQNQISHINNADILNRLLSIAIIVVHIQLNNSVS